MTNRGRKRSMEPNYRWVVEWNEQQIWEEIGGEMKKVTVLEGREYCLSWEGVEQAVKRLEKWWPGIKLRISPVGKGDYVRQESVLEADWEDKIVPRKNVFQGMARLAAMR